MFKRIVLNKRPDDEFPNDFSIFSTKFSEIPTLDQLKENEIAI